MSIEVFDADSLMHVGTAKVPLYRIMRQGKLVVAKGLDCEICESQHGNIIGTLQMLITNQSVEPSNSKVFEENQAKRIQPSQKQSRFKKIESVPMNLTA